MTESEFICPKYTEGANVCCLANHEKRLKDFGNYPITLEYVDGNKITVNSIEFADTQLGHNNRGEKVWISFLVESSEVVEIQLSNWLDLLTPESQQKIFDIHSGLETTPLADECPFNKPSQ